MNIWSEEHVRRTSEDVKNVAENYANEKLGAHFQCSIVCKLLGTYFSERLVVQSNDFQPFPSRGVCKLITKFHDTPQYCILYFAADLIGTSVHFFKGISFQIPHLFM